MISLTFEAKDDVNGPCVHGKSSCFTQSVCFNLICSYKCINTYLWARSSLLETLTATRVCKINHGKIEFRADSRGILTRFDPQ